jgi:hypothetical protein
VGVLAPDAGVNPAAYNPVREVEGPAWHLVAADSCVQFDLLDNKPLNVPRSAES